MNKYEKRFCLFLDILGFQELVTKSFQRGEEINRLYNGLQTIHKAFHIYSHALHHTSKMVTQFSDSIVVSYKMEEQDSVYNIIHDAYMLQLELIEHRMLIRGAITCGELFHDGDLVFGPALLEAVNLEKYAMYPRIILDKEIINMGGRFSGYHDTKEDWLSSLEYFIQKDFDEMFFLNYFKPDADDFDYRWSSLCNHLISLRDLIQDSLNKPSTPGVRLKYQWMKNKFNDVILNLKGNNYASLYDERIPTHSRDRFENIEIIE